MVRLSLSLYIYIRGCEGWNILQHSLNAWSKIQIIGVGSYFNHSARYNKKSHDSNNGMVR